MADLRLLRIGTEGSAAFSVQGLPSLQCEGVPALVQTLIVQLLTTPGSDALNVVRGAGLVSLLQTTRVTEALEEEIVSRIKTVERNRLEAQKGMPGLPEDERLFSFALIGIRTNPDDPTEILIDMAVKTASETSVRFTL